MLRRFCHLFNGCTLHEYFAEMFDFGNVEIYTKVDQSI